METISGFHSFLPPPSLKAGKKATGSAQVKAGGFLALTVCSPVAPRCLSSLIALIKYHTGGLKQQKCNTPQF